jgi:predicted transcriptional regulator
MATWTKKDENFVRDNYKTMPIAQLCLLLGRTPIQVRNKANCIGVRRRNMLRYLEKDILYLYSRQMCDSAIARELGLDQGGVSRWLRKRGLPPHGSWGPDQDIAKWRRACNIRARQIGASSIQELALCAKRLRYLSLMPGCTTKTQVAVMKAIKAANADPLTAPQIAAAANVHEWTARRAIYELVKAGVLLRSSDKVPRYYPSTRKGKERRHIPYPSDEQLRRLAGHFRDEWVESQRVRT